MNNINNPTEPEQPQAPGLRFWHWLAARSIKAKLELIIMVVSSAGILLAGISLVIYEWYIFRDAMVSDLSTLSEVIADNSKSAVLTGDSTDAARTLNSLINKNTVISAAIFKQDDKLLAAYFRDKSKPSLPPDKKLFNDFDAFVFHPDFLVVQKPVYLDGRVIGTVYLSSDYSELHNLVSRLSYTVLLVLVLVETFAYILASHMQRYISQPLLSLAKLARQISQQQNYSLRAIKQSDDEMGSLSEDFNAMLVQVEKRDYALRQSESRFETLIEHAADALYLCTMDGKVLHVNQSACRTLGYTKAELLTLSMAEIDIEFSPASGLPIPSAQPLQSAWQQLKVGESKTSYSHFQCVDGRVFPVELHFGLLDLDGGPCVLSFARDISQRKQTEALLKQANDKLESKVAERTQELRESNSQLLKAKDKAEAASRVKSEFLANMSHEIRTPMNSVMGFTDLLQDTELNIKQHSYLNSIQSGAKGLMTIINDVLDLSKIEAGKLRLEYEPVDTLAFIHDVKQLVTQDIKDKGLDFDVIIDSSIPSLLILDQTRIRQILFNLLSNAIKFTRKGFIRVTITHTVEPPDPDQSSEQQQSSVGLSIAVGDSGIGIKADQIDLIFEQFTQQEGQSTRQYGGTGLGLAICSNLARMMGGSIGVTSTEGEGSIFTLNLSNIKVAQAVQTTIDKKPASSKVVFAAAKVLLVDDIEANRVLVKEQFADSQIVFSEAENGLTAIEKAREELPDLIIMDIRMPVMNGIVANQRLKQDALTRDIPVVALTASIAKAEVDPATHRQFNSFLHKPARKGEIYDTFKRYLKYQTIAAETVETATDTVAETISKADGKKLLRVLDDEVEQLFETAQSSGLMGDIIQLGDKLTAVGKEFNSQKIIDYSDELGKAAELFDIEKIESLLLEFRALVSYYKVFVQLKDENDA